ncbi:DnaJ-domain-containing protein [Ascodesmis nigricans]|uniref:DnaJ-domain-containing protein n=1 Tax=Ascodesmis nigricans TaxID=341454 RepID=A0A4V3SIJ7_9PEZI|nr:DnaJ-domain-containing protein [Ascodesmis nigricans]
MSSSSASGRDEKSGSSTSSAPRFREHSHGRQDREFTTEQKAAVERIRRCKTTAYYEILSVTKDASDGQIKKAYHKLSLATHPDKNGAPGADEAFKLVSKAFQVLSDPQKRSIYDSTGADPENRRVPPTSSSFSGGSPFGPRGGGRPFEADLTPEDLFNMFFGGGGNPIFGDAFGPGASFTFGGPGIRVHQFGGAGPRMRRTARTHTHPAAGGGAGTAAGNTDSAPLPPISRMFWQLLPLIIFFILPMLSGLFTSTPSAKGPRFHTTPSPPFTEMRTTPTHEIPFWVDPKDVQDMTRKQASEFEKRVEARIVNEWSVGCRKEEMEREREMQDAIGIFFTDYERLEKAKRKEMPSCAKIEEVQKRSKRKMN